MWTLAIECSSARGGVALDRGGAPAGEWSFEAGRGPGGAFFQALKGAVHTIGDETLDEIIVGLGPGSYSGVRQAIAAATGLSMARRSRLTGLPSTVALETTARSYHALGDARRGAFYYTAVVDNVCAAEPQLINLESALELLAAHPQWPAFAETGLDGLPVTAGVFPAAARLLTAPAATRRLAPLEPIYLRDPAITLPKPRRALS